MANICIDCPIRPIMSPILSAILPETPVSISSNIIVGNDVYLASSPLSESITLDSSPPEATLEMSRRASGPLAENRKSRRSPPEAVSLSPGETAARNTACGISRERISDCSSADSAPQAPLRSSDSFPAKSFLALSSEASSFLSSSSLSCCSSAPSMDAARLSLSSISSFSPEHPYFL